MKITATQLEKYSIDDLERLKAQIESIIEIKSCNVATVNTKTGLFDTSHDPNVFTIEIDNKILGDFQRMRSSEGEDIRKSILALMDFYNSNDALNIILLHDVLEERQSYIKYTAQLANYLTHNQQKYQQVKVQFDQLTTRLGIFCRTGDRTTTLNATFLGSVTAALLAYGSAHVPLADIPMSYLGNRAALKHLLTHRLEKTPTIRWHKEGVTIFANNPK